MYSSDAADAAVGQRAHHVRHDRGAGGFGSHVWRITILQTPRHVTSRDLLYAMVALMLPDGVTVTS